MNDELLFHYDLYETHFQVVFSLSVPVPSPPPRKERGAEERVRLHVGSDAFEITKLIQF